MSQPRTQGVDHGRGQGPDKYVLIGELGFDEMCRDDLADGVCVHEANVERKGDQMVVEDVRLQEEIQGNQRPGAHDWDESLHGRTNGLIAALAGTGNELAAVQGVGLLA